VCRDDSAQAAELPDDPGAGGGEALDQRGPALSLGARFCTQRARGDSWRPGKSNDVVVVTFAASGIVQDDRMCRLQGNAGIHTASQVLVADDASYHSDSGEIDANVDVRVRPVASLP